MSVCRCRLLFTTVLIAHIFPTQFAAAAEPDDPDANVQGEYTGEVEGVGTKTTLGVQVIARGKGKFRAVGYWGGLPGDGWDKSDTLLWEGELSKDVLTLKGDDYQARLERGTMLVERKDGFQCKLARIQRRSATLGVKPPRGAVVLFDGKNVDEFDGGKITDDELLRPGGTSKRKFQSGTLHVEFQIPYGPLIPSRGNSGVYLQSRYEVQILDSIGYAPHNHECGGIPSVRAPDLTMSYPPLAWQTYDVEFTAAEYRSGKKVSSAKMSVRHNGVLIHDNVEVPHATTSSPLAEGPEPGPLNLQEHGSEVRFRNIWFLPKSE